MIRFRLYRISKNKRTILNTTYHTLPSGLEKVLGDLALRSPGRGVPELPLVEVVRHRAGGRGAEEESDGRASHRPARRRGLGVYFSPTFFIFSTVMKLFL